MTTLSKRLMAYRTTQVKITNAKLIGVFCCAVLVVETVYLIYDLYQTQKNAHVINTNENVTSNQKDIFKQQAINSYVVLPTKITNNEPVAFDPTRNPKYEPYNSKAVEEHIHTITSKNGEEPYFFQCVKQHINTTWAKNQHQMLLDLFNWLVLEPVVALNELCHPPPLPDPAKMDCQTAFPNAGFNGSRRQQPRKLAVAFNLGFEADVLEMHLAEVFGVVDKIFICESVHTSQRNEKTSHVGAPQNTATL